jgi:hypothetical protein
MTWLKTLKMLETVFEAFLNNTNGIFYVYASTDFNNLNG